MDAKKIFITQSDYNRLKEIITNTAAGQNIDKRSLDELERSYGARDGTGLIETVKKLRNSRSDAEWARIEELAVELDRAVVIESDKIPHDVVTMNSRVCLRDMDTGKDEFYQVVYPEDADVEQNRISVLAPIGTAILGYKVGDVIEWKVPAGLRRLKIKKILYQPEEAGDHHL